ncbi:hypothetical protein C3Y87_17480 [Carbonactinospora thermoautotrophica]|uniref:hypothetical protein n=1 Tax=Carbonactinospora thermoautotrophica TaxID=1469144 RepID=UPI00226FE104|nr:hypothetical protein [Carbonactinospora thermoautotrophica]MCX9193162.1 hypothetical protein [Carbonactinospora thermoautotrophica]
MTEPTRAPGLSGERITLDQLAVDLNGAAVWLRQLALAAERPDVPIELGELCDELDRTAKHLEEMSQVIAEVDRIITERVPLKPFFPGREPWGARAHRADPDRQTWPKRLSTVLTHWQIRSLAREDMPWRDEEPGIPYLDGLAGLPDLENWESPRAARRRAAERLDAIQAQALRESCERCDAGPGQPCRTSTGRLAEAYHRPRIHRATAVVDGRADHSGNHGWPLP